MYACSSPVITFGQVVTDTYNRAYVHVDLVPTQISCFSQEKHITASNKISCSQLPQPLSKVLEVYLNTPSET